MRFGEIDVPRQLLDAHRDGKLVLFVGAGASCDPPSCLPLFEGLARRIATDAGRQLDAGSDPTAELGRLESDGVGVRPQIEQIVGDPDSAPNRFHRALGRLAASAPNLRVVTTNYDPHLSTVLDALGREYVEYAAPALPLGNDFEGVVYLHGKVWRAGSQLVATDSDFGGAYLLSAWAARFLEAMFRTYIVLFVGYSHNDVVMKFIGRALRNRDRYILTDRPHDRDWTLLGITPIGYFPPDSGPHEEVLHALERLAVYTEMGLVEHAAEVARLLSTPPSLTLAEDHYLSEIIADHEKVALFTRHARGKEWLSWANQQPCFQALFDRTASRTQVGAKLARWLTERFLFDEQLINEGLRTIASHGDALCWDLWNTVGQWLHADASRRDETGKRLPRPPWQRHLIPLLAGNAPDPPTPPWLEYALGATDLPVDRDSALLLLDVLLTPTLERSNRAGMWRPELRVRGEAAEIGLSWDKHIRPNLDAIADELLPICEHHLRSANRMTTLADKPSVGTYGPWAIPDARFRQYSRDLEPLVAITRDVLDHLGNVDAERSTAIARNWADSSVIVLRRLALHATSRRVDLSADEKLQFILGRGWIWDPHLHGDVVRFIDDATEGASEGFIRELVDQLESDPLGYDDPNLELAARFSMITLIANKTGSPSTIERRDAYIEANPDLESVGAASAPRIEVGFRGQNPPMTIAELHDAVENDAKSAASRLLTFRTRDEPFNSPGWLDVTRLISETVTEYPSDGFTLLEAFDYETTIVAAVCAAWNTVNGPTIAERVLGTVTRLDLIEHADAISQMLDPGSANAFNWCSLPVARDLAERCWETISTSETQVGRDVTSTARADDDCQAGPDWLASSLSHSAGRIAAFWLHAIQYDWQSEPENYTGLDAQTARVLGSIFSRDTHPHRLAQVRVGCQLHFLFGADRSWTIDELLPRFQWDDPNQATRMWAGFLYWGRWNDTLLDLGLLDAYIGTFHHVARFSSEETEGLVHHVVAIILWSTSDRIELLDSFTATVDPSIRCRFIDEVAWTYDDVDTSSAEAQWGRWMQRYWSRRLTGAPLNFEPDEATAIVRWVHIVGKHSAAAAELALRRSASLPEHCAPSEIVGEQLLANHPETAAQLLAHLLSGTDPASFYYHPDLKTTLKSLDGRISMERRRELDAQAIRFGLID